MNMLQHEIADMKSHEFAIYMCISSYTYSLHNQFYPAFFISTIGTSDLGTKHWDGCELAEATTMDEAIRIGMQLCSDVYGAGAPTFVSDSRIHKANQKTTVLVSDEHKFCNEGILFGIRSLMYLAPRNKRRLSLIHDKKRDGEAHEMMSRHLQNLTPEMYPHGEESLPLPPAPTSSIGAMFAFARKHFDPRFRSR